MEKEVWWKIIFYIVCFAIFAGCFYLFLRGFGFIDDDTSKGSADKKPTQDVIPSSARRVTFEGAPLVDDADEDQLTPSSMASHAPKSGTKAYSGSSKTNDTFDLSTTLSSGVRTSEFAPGTGDGTRKLVADASQVIANSIKAQRKISDDATFAMFNAPPKIGNDGGRSFWAKEKIAPIHESLLDGKNPLLNLPPDFHKFVFSNSRNRGLVANKNPTIGGKWDRV